MKNILVTLLSVVLAVTCFATMAFAADVSVKLDGETLSFEQPPVIIEGRTLVPLRAIFEALGASVEWDGDTKTVTSAKGDVTIKLTIGSNVLYKNAESVELDVPAQIVGEGYTMVPARAIAESYGVTVDWDDATKTVILTSPAEPEAPVAEKVEGAIVNLLVADTYEQSDLFYTTNTLGGQLVVVDNPKAEGDKVFYLESNVTEKDAWTYFWAKPENNYVAGGRYIVEYDVLVHDTDARGEKIEKPVGIGNNIRYGEQGIPSKDHGVGQTNVGFDEWVHIMLVTTVPETLDPAAEMRFGIYATPREAHCYSFYFDNLSVLPYTGDYADGFVDHEAIERAKKLDSFDIDAVDGLVFGFDGEDFAPFSLSKAYDPVVANGHFDLTIGDDDSIDVQFGTKEIDFTADDYNRIAFKLKFDGEGIEKTYFGVYFATEEDPKLSQAKSVHHNFPLTKLTDDGYYVGVLDMASNENWNGKIVEIRFDPVQGVYGTVSIDKIVLFKE